MLFGTTVKVINKNIIYSDTVLSVKDMGKNIRVNSISNIDENDMEKCINKILESNPDVIFNTIQYSRSNKKVYFYTDKDISLEAWNNRNTKRYSPVNSSSMVLREIKNILESSNNDSYDYISLYEVSRIMSRKMKEYKHTVKEYEYKLENAIKSTNSSIYENIYVTLHRFDYNNNYFSISINSIDCNKNRSGEIFIGVNDDDLYLLKSTFRYGEDIFLSVSEYLKPIYCFLLKYKDLLTQKSSFKNIDNSKLEFCINSYGVKIAFYQMDKFVFDLIYYINENKYKYIKCNSSKILEVVKGNEDELFKRVFVKIDKCPEWIRPILYENRKYQLDEEKRIEEEKLKEEKKKQKILNIKKKLFPFLVK